jgi:hypothetical protein
VAKQFVEKALLIPGFSFPERGNRHEFLIFSYDLWRRNKTNAEYVIIWQYKLANYKEKRSV